ncbi:DUF5919 domain-containing protein [Haloechinothrix sp. LS1_15]|uniref:helix-turn-helix domain-containing protein n=1 Tax=Haloechinothrix sp. LS1_15 TaxID=2652248 RepID=UPI002947EC50|nr:DUF5919 domain-containing protein [Haloechinothrix sp. LS1_15]MDV6014523.1 XRE family transcriptional regulator [Haloechinothrix sp. LS1_15]
MVNERLRAAMESRGINPVELAHSVGVDPKTVERWIGTERVPYSRHRRAVAAKLEVGERYLWPNAVSIERADRASQSEVVQVYPHRNAVPDSLWDRLITEARTYVDVLVYVGMFLTEKPTLVDTLRAKAESGARIRLLFGERNSDAVIRRSLDEGIGRNTISAKIDHALAHFAPLKGTRGVEIRTHDAVLYNSIYRFDDEMIVNPHVFGKLAAHAPAMHLRRLAAGELFTTYADSVDAVWETARAHTW